MGRCDHRDCVVCKVGLTGDCVENVGLHDRGQVQRAISWVKRNNQVGIVGVVGALDGTRLKARGMNNVWNQVGLEVVG